MNRSSGHDMLTCLRICKPMSMGFLNARDVTIGIVSMIVVSMLPIGIIGIGTVVESESMLWTI